MDSNMLRRIALFARWLT